MRDVIAWPIPEVESREYLSIRIAHEKNGMHIFGHYRVGDIPFSQPPRGQPRLTAGRKPIKIDEAPEDPGATFEGRMRTVRLANSIRLGGNYGATIGNRDYRNQEPRREVGILRPGIRIAPEEARAVVPPPPVTPKPRPPPRPVRIRPPPMFLRPALSQREILRALQSLTPNSHLPLRLISDLVQRLTSI